MNQKSSPKFSPKFSQKFSQKFSKNVHLYYLTVLTVMLVSLVAGIRYYWILGPINLENVSAIFEAGVQIDEIQKKDYPHQLMELVGSDRVRDAVKLLEQFEKDSKSLHQNLKAQSSIQLTNDFKTLKIALNNLISYPEISGLISVLGNKVTSFESFVIQNNWKTLGRMVKRLAARISLNQTRLQGRFSVGKLSELIDSIEKDIQAMEKVTDTSVLSPESKTQILTKLKTFSTEFEMLSNYLTHLKKFESEFQKYNGTYKNWISEILPEVGYKRIQFEKSSQNILISLTSFVFATLVFMFMGCLIYVYNEKKQKNKIENIVIKSIKDGLIPIENKMDVKFSSKFHAEFEFYREYLHKRMSFGLIFQEAIPFPGLLLDGHLNLVWANTLFYESWEIPQNSGRADNNYTWDTLQKFTNLGEADPIMAALERGVAGIYNIQVRPPSQEEAGPFEMYVSPVEYAGLRRIMILFYPLRAVEETLSNQTKALVGPVARVLDSLSSGTFDKNFHEKIKGDFEIAGIPQILTKFCQYDAKNKQQKNELFTEIENLTGSIFDHHKMIEDTKMLLKAQEKLGKNVEQKFTETKRILIDIIDARGDLEALYNSTTNASKNLYKDEVKLLNQAQNINELLAENIKALESVDLLRSEFKGIKENVAEFRIRVNQALEQTLMFRNYKTPDYKIEDSLNKIRNEMKNFDRTLEDLTRMNRSFDVCLSKINLVMEDHTPISFDDIKNKFVEAREIIETNMFNVGRLMRDACESDEEMIHTLKAFHGSFIESKRGLKQLTAFLSEHEVLEKQMV